MTISEQIKLFCVGLSVMFKERPPEISARTNGTSDNQPHETDPSAAESMPPAEVPGNPRNS